MPDLTGQNIGPYRLVEQLGDGAMATVYRAYQSRLDRSVALKCIHSQLVAAPGFLQRFEREAKILARLAHPNGETAHIGPASDVYALGVVLYELLTGQAPFTADTPLAVVLKHLNEPIPLVRALNPALPEALEPVLRTALAKDPAARYQRAGELAQAFQGAVAVAASCPAPAMHQSLPLETTPQVSARPDAPKIAVRLAEVTGRHVMAAEQPVTFGAPLRCYREAAGLSQENLAERAGVTAAAIGALERGERKRPYPHTV